MPSLAWTKPKDELIPTAQAITKGVLDDSEPLPTCEQFVQCTTSDIAFALHEAAKAYLRKAEALLTTNPEPIEEEDASSSSGIISPALAWWKHVAAEDVVRMGSKGDRDAMIGSLIMCLDSIKDLEYEML